MSKHTRKTILVVVLVAVLAALLFALRPKPLLVESALVRRDVLEVTVEGEGETRVRHRFTVSSPVAGRLARPTLREGDEVAAGSVLARIYPLPLDARARQEAEARLDGALSSERAARARAKAALALLEHERETLRRDELLAAAQLLPREDLEHQRSTVEAAEQARLAAELEARAAGFEAATQRAALAGAAASGSSPAMVSVLSPASGRLLRLFEECECVVQAGAPLLEVGDLGDLEVVVDVLSEDAVKIGAGAAMRLEAWGGEEPLAAVVTRVEPAGFAKVSPLGIEERRVEVVGALRDPPKELGDRFRVEASIIIWSGNDVLQVPSGAVFRHGSGWSVFVVDVGRAKLRAVTLGQRAPKAVEIIAGLEEGERVIVHPGDPLADGARVTYRSSP